jgi:hypothetical protein
MPPTPRTAALAARVLAPSPPEPPAPAVVTTPVVDDQKEDRVRYVVQQLATGAQEKDVLRGVQRTYAVPRDQAVLDFADARDLLRSALDDEGAIDAVAYGALARLHTMQDSFFQLALEPIESRVLDVPAPLPDDVNAPYRPDGPGAIFRTYTPGEHASAVGARVQAGKLALALNETLLRIAGRRSTRWHERPQVVVQTPGGNGFTADEEAFFKSIGVLK